MSANPILADALRGGIVESFHRGAWALVDADGRVVASAGDIERPVFPRSAVKVLQALPLVASGAAEALGLSDEELALACASHGGEPAHVHTAASMLAKAGRDAGALECGAHWPYQDGALKALARADGEPTALHNNCSGKHAGFVCLGCHRGLSTAGYVQPDHPVMREVTASLQSTTGFDLTGAARGIDGCSIPTYAIPLRHLAHAFAKVATGRGLDADAAHAAARLRAAVAAAPFMVGGTGRLDTRLMAHFGARLFCKVGAEGMYCAALPEAGLGLAIKMDDGNNARAVEVVLAALLRQWLQPDEAGATLLDAVADQPLVNWRGLEVGRLRARQ